MITNATLPHRFALLAATLALTAAQAQTFDSGWPAPDGVVDKVLYDPGSDQVFIGGSFANVGGQPRSYLAAYNAATGTLASWAPVLDGYVGAMAVSGTTLYVGGGFQNIDGSPRDHLAAFDITTGTLLSGWHPDVDSYVYDMTLTGTTLWLAGDFHSVAGVTFNNVAGVDAGGFGQPVNWAGDWCDELCWTVSVSGTTVYTGGQFFTIGGQSRYRIAALGSATGHATSWNPSASDNVRCVVASGSTVYAGGTFGTIGGASRQNIAAINASDGTATAWDPNASDGVITIVPNGSVVYVGGAFTLIGGQSRNGFARIDASTGLATAWNAGLANGPNTIFINSIAVNGSHVYVGGDFATVTGVGHPYFASWSGVASGIEEEPAVPQVNAYPDPTDGPLHFGLTDATARTLEVVNVLGEEVLSTAYQPDVDLRSLPAGTYSITVRDADGKALARTRVVRD